LNSARRGLLRGERAGPSRVDSAPRGAAESTLRRQAMFEDSTFESAHRIHTRSRTWGVVAFTFNGLILAALVAIPLIYPEALPRRFVDVLLTAPPPPPATPRPPEPQRAQAAPSVTQLVDGHMFAPRRIPRDIAMVNRPDAPLSDLPSIPGAIGSGNGDNPAAIFSGHNDRPAVVQSAPKGPTIISRGVAEGMLLQKVTPRYPPIAQASHTQGTVVLQAVISKNGMIENLRVLSGSPMLTQAALDAVSQWRYRPYLLNGEPVAVETTINVVFRMNQ